MSPFKPRPLLGLLAIATGAIAGAPLDEARMEQLFRPLLGERTALSRGGDYLAYTSHTGRNLTIVVLDLATFKTKARILADEDRPMPNSPELQRADLRFLAWADGDRLVFAPTIETRASPSSGGTLGDDHIPPPPPTIIAPIMAVDADGSHPQTLVDADKFSEAGEAHWYVQRAPHIEGFPAGNKRDALLIEVRGVGTGDPTKTYRLDIRTGALTTVGHDTVQGRMYYDRSGQPRINQVMGRNGASFYLRVGNSSRWQDMPDPPPGGVHFTRTPETYFGERALMLGLDFDPNVLIYAANAGRDTFGVYGMDLTTRQRTKLAIEVPGVDLVALDERMPSPHLVFDEYRQKLVGLRVNGVRPRTFWLDPELTGLQKLMDEGFRGRNPEIVEWNEARTRLLVRVTGGSDPGRTYLFRRPEKSMVELMRRAPWLRDEELHETKFVAFPGPDGAHLTAYLTLPRTPRLNPPPLIVEFAAGLPPVPQPEFDPQAEVLADMGFMVCRLNQRGVSGTGRRDRDALRRDPNGVPVADALAAVDWIAGHFKVDRKRVATLGEGLAGYFALRAAGSKPEVFRCAVVFDPLVNFTALLEPVDSSGGPPPGATDTLQPIGRGGPTFDQQVKRAYLEGGGAKLSQLSLGGAELNVPVFVATHRPGNDAETSIAAGVTKLRLELKLKDIPSVALEYDDDFAQGLPAARARLYGALQEFFNLNLYDYKVKIGPTQTVP